MEVSSLSDGEEWASAESQDTDPGDAGANKTVEDRQSRYNDVSCGVGQLDVSTWPEGIELGEQGLVSQATPPHHGDDIIWKPTQHF